MLICKKCNGGIADIYPVGESHKCPTQYHILPGYYPPKAGVKCDMCGSTAIDHTETQCQLNQEIKRNNP